MTVDTACSAGLVAFDVAKQSLQSGACKTALVAGVNTLLGCSGFLMMCAGHMLAPDAYCKTFDKSAGMHTQYCLLLS